MREFWRTLSSHRSGLAGLGFVVLLLAAALAAPLLFPGDPDQIGEDITLAPSLHHLLGTDDLGRDILAGIVYGTRVSLTVGVMSALVATVVGSLIGALAGFQGGLIDLVVMRVSEIFQVVPTFILAALIVALSGSGLTQIITVIAVLAWPQTARLMRGEVLRIKRLEFAAAMRCMGIRETRILLFEIMPNALAPVLTVGTLIVGQSILLEAALSFFGLGNPDVVSWGRILNRGQQFLGSAWWMSLFPGMAIFLTVLSFNLLGDAIGVALDPRHGQRGR
jgi:peptide/nickel transport system permease protein